MKIILTTGIYPPQVGGPAYYAVNLKNALEEQGVEVVVLTYNFENKLPPGIRHIWFGLRLLKNLSGAHSVITLDTFSVGLPSVFVGSLRQVPVIVRVGGDFLWEKYVQKRSVAVTLRDFYNTKNKLSLYEKIVFYLTCFVVRKASAVVFSTKWQADIWSIPYNIKKNKIFIIENFYGPKKNNQIKKWTEQLTFIWAGRPLFLKNIDRLKEIFKEIQIKHSNLSLELYENLSQTELFNKLKQASVVIVPSLSDISPNLVLESLMFNTPVIVTSETGLADRLGECVSYVNPKDNSDIADKIISISSEMEYNKKAELVAKFNFEHSYSQIASEFLNIFKLL